MSASHFVIVGAGPAGATAAQTLRERGFDGALTVLGAEPHRPYMRPPLSKQYLRGEADRDSVFLQSAEWYAENNVELRTSASVEKLDVAAHQVQLADGTHLGYDSLLLATGSTPRRLDLEGADLDGVHALRTIDQSEALAAELAGGGRRVVVIGSGWIGMEVAASATLLGNHVTVLSRGALPLDSAIADLGGFFADLHTARGVQLRGAVTIAALEGDGGRVSAVVLADGERVPAEVVLVAVGATPNVELARAAGIAIDNGVLTDERMRTSAADVLAAGDIANALHPTAGVRIRSEHFSNAMKGAKAAALTMLGENSPYDDLPTFVSEQFDVTLQFAGYAPLLEGARLVYRGDPASNSFTAFWLADGRAVAGAHVNVPDKEKHLQRIIRTAVALDAERAADTSITLEQL